MGHVRKLTKKFLHEVKREDPLGKTPEEIAVEQQTETEKTLELLRTAAFQLAEVPRPLELKRMSHQLLLQASRLAKATGFK